MLTNPRLILSWLAAAAALLAPVAHAEVWGWIDGKGTAHFASEAVDARYRLLFRDGESFDSRDLHAGDGASAAAVEPAGAAARRMRGLLDISAGAKSAAPYLRNASRVQELDFELLQALVAAESGFDASAVSPKGAVGLMQVMPATAQRWGVSATPRQTVQRQLADPAVNIRTGSRYLRYLVDLFPGQLELALAAYNAGENAVQRAGNRIPDYPETRNYVKTVMQLYRLLKPGAGDGLQATPPQRVRMEIPAGTPDAVAQAGDETPDARTTFPR